ncbi:MAG: ParE family toxin-like protein [Chthoniobacterales bacterium]
MISKCTRDFWALYDALPAAVRDQARNAFLLFRENPDHPSLRFKKLTGPHRYWSVRFGAGYRVVCQREGDTIVWLWIGTHQDFDKAF